MRGTLKVNWLNHSCSWMQNQTPILRTIVILGKGTYWRFLVSIVYEVWVGRQETLPAQLYLGFCTEISLGKRPLVMGKSVLDQREVELDYSVIQASSSIVLLYKRGNWALSECQRFHQEWNFFHLNSDVFYRVSLLKSPGYVKYRVLQNMFTITAGTNRPEVYNLASGRLAVFCEKIYHIFICFHMTIYILLNERCDISKTTCDLTGLSSGFLPILLSKIDITYSKIIHWFLMVRPNLTIRECLT